MHGGVIVDVRVYKSEAAIMKDVGAMVAYVASEEAADDLRKVLEIMATKE
jgi:hypothetical protein